MTYLLMSVPFIVIAGVVFAIGCRHAAALGGIRPYLLSWAAAAVTLLVLTAVFDNAMMAAGLFDYGADKISGARLGLMPLEDFLYPLAGSLLLAGLWQLLGSHRKDALA
ncbi:lycopene cyclase domain-containing protein [Paramicrobacterium humi]|uniref:Lycopene cyclase domain-containing protein n=1 Tax=Paramicrobacterium humi TaxID=640635 RepID=A0A1H4N8H9_9MICO|nr:lycopene cyclase domain-containing protein [Microbacterium humi]SEB91324.1 lycopene cyclase domain-containing protein [Microbacterium humi]